MNRWKAFFPDEFEKIIKRYKRVGYAKFCMPCYKPNHSLYVAIVSSLLHDGGLGLRFSDDTDLQLSSMSQFLMFVLTGPTVAQLGVFFSSDCELRLLLCLTQECVSLC